MPRSMPCTCAAFCTTVTALTLPGVMAPSREGRGVARDRTARGRRRASGSRAGSRPPRPGRRTAEARRARPRRRAERWPPTAPRDRPVRRRTDPRARGRAARVARPRAACHASAARRYRRLSGGGLPTARRRPAWRRRPRAQQSLPPGCRTRKPQSTGTAGACRATWCGAPCPCSHYATSNREEGAHPCAVVLALVRIPLTLDRWTRRARGALLFHDRESRAARPIIVERRGGRLDRELIVAWQSLRLNDTRYVSPGTITRRIASLETCGKCAKERDSSWPVSS